MKTLKEYQEAATRTMTLGRFPTSNDSLTCDALGIAGEAGEVADLIKKVLFHGKPLDREAVTKELGDVLWYVAAIATDLGISLEDIAAVNVAKLQARYPNGFNQADSQARRDLK